MKQRKTPTGADQGFTLALTKIKGGTCQNQRGQLPKSEAINCSDTEARAFRAINIGFGIFNAD